MRKEYNYKVIEKSQSGHTKLVTKIYFEIDNPKTYASYVMLKNYYTERDETIVNSFKFRMQKIAFSRSYLSKVLADKGCLTCSYCDKSNLVIEFDGMKVPKDVLATVDHVVPTSKGGGHFDVNNIRVACSTCNSKKGDKPVDNFLKNISNKNLHKSKKKPTFEPCL